MRDARHDLLLPTLLFVAIALRTAAPAVAQSAPPEPAKGAAAGSTAATDDLSAKLAAIEKAIDSRRRRLHVPGASLVIVRDDRVIYLKGLGFRDVEQRLPVTPKTLFAIGSSTKAFTAMTVMMSADDGKLSLEDSPKKYLPYISTKSFLLLKRVETVVVPGSGASLPVSETVSDYRPADGVMVPFRRVRAIPEMGDTILTVKSVRFDVRVADAVFRPGAKK
jgi:hypothetical protein